MGCWAPCWYVARCMRRHPPPPHLARFTGACTTCAAQGGVFSARAMRTGKAAARGAAAAASGPSRWAGSEWIPASGQAVKDWQTSRKVRARGFYPESAAPLAVVLTRAWRPPSLAAGAGHRAGHGYQRRPRRGGGHRTRRRCRGSRARSGRKRCRRTRADGSVRPVRPSQRQASSRRDHQGVAVVRGRLCVHRQRGANKKATSGQFAGDGTVHCSSPAASCQLTLWQGKLRAACAECGKTRTHVAVLGSQASGRWERGQERGGGEGGQAGFVSRPSEGAARTTPSDC